MSMISFEESGMKFKFHEDKCFRIEKDTIINRLNSVKCCECVSQVKDFVVFLEAKSSAPKKEEVDCKRISYNGDVIPERWSIMTRFDQYIDEIARKFQDSFFFVKAALEGWHGQDKKKELESKFKLTNRNINFLLIIKNAEKNWLPDIKDGLVNHLRHFIKAWNIKDTSIKVVNQELAAIIGIEIQ